MSLLRQHALRHDHAGYVPNVLSVLASSQVNGAESAVLRAARLRFSVTLRGERIRTQRFLARYADREHKGFA
jgi:hypothetical protein